MRDRARGAQLAETWIPAWLRKEFAGARVVLVDHHNCHAATAYYPSPFDEATVITLDEAGDGRTGTVSSARGLELEQIAEATFPDSLGNLVSRTAALIGFSSFGDEHKLQWLSPSGDPRYADVFRAILRPRDGSLLNIDQSYLTADAEAVRENGSPGFSAKFYSECGLDAGQHLPAEVIADIAASLQLALNETVNSIATRADRGDGSKNICLAGGVALNALLIQHLETAGRFQGVFTHPAAGNAGNAMGAALHVAHQVLGITQRQKLEHLFIGPEFTDEEIKDILENSKLSFRYLPRKEELIDESVQVLRENQILGWFQGRVEFGPRALGSRCILASPLGKYVNENLNQYVKHREKFRPFAAAVPAEMAAEYFEFSDSAKFLTSVGRVKEKHRELFASNVLAGREGLAEERRIRVQVVDRDTNHYLWELLSAFGRASGVPVLFNTSFNLFGEPLVCSPRDAIRSFYCSGLDHLMIGPFSLCK
jgi:carbamoyltransferase